MFTLITILDHGLERTVSGREPSHDEIRLVPRPSADPADPLNFARWRKLAILACMSIVPFVVNFTAASISSAFPIMATPLAFNPPVPMSSLSHLIAVCVLVPRDIRALLTGE